MNDAMHRTVEALAVSALAAAEWHKDCRPRRMARAIAWERRRDAYDRASSLAAAPMAERAQVLAIAANRRALAWRALAAMDVHEAKAHRRQGQKARAMHAGLTQGVWRT
jgi:hypothetical protein